MTWKFIVVCFIGSSLENSMIQDLSVASILITVQSEISISSLHRLHHHDLTHFELFSDWTAASPWLQPGSGSVLFHRFLETFKKPNKCTMYFVPSYINKIFTISLNFT